MSNRPNPVHYLITLRAGNGAQGGYTARTREEAHAKALRLTAQYAGSTVRVYLAPRTDGSGPAAVYHNLDNGTAEVRSMKNSTYVDAPRRILSLAGHN